MDKQFYDRIIEYVGGLENIESVYHCVTRIRFLIREKSRVRLNDIKQLHNVIDASFVNGQLMIIFDADLLVTYEAIIERLDQKDYRNIYENSFENIPFINRIYNSVSRYLLATINPVIDIMIGVGILKILLIIIDCALKNIDKANYYAFFSNLFWMVYLLIPIIASFNGAIALGIKPAYSIIVATVISIDMYLKGVVVNNVRISLECYDYNWFRSNLLLPSLLIAPTLFYLEKIIKKHYSVISNQIVIGVLLISCSILINYFFVFPIGIILNNVIVNTLLFLNDFCGPILIAIITASLPFIIIKGIHASFGPLLMTMLIVSNGYDPMVRVAFLIHNFAEGGAVLGSFLKNRTKVKGKEAKYLNAIRKCVINGITEPALMKINIKRQENMFGVMIGGALAGFLANYWNAKAYFWGEATILALPIFLDTIGYMMVSLFIAFFVSAMITFFLGFRQHEC